MILEQHIALSTQNLIQTLFDTCVPIQQIQVQKTNEDFEGDLTLVVFPFVKLTKKSPEDTAKLIGDHLQNQIEEIIGYNVIKGFLNFVIKPSYYLQAFDSAFQNPNFGIGAPSGETLVVEYSSPNTNKPLHLGHIRNNLLGWSVAEILKAGGNDVRKVNLVNDRGIHICKSMLAWLKYGNGETPNSSGLKGDHLVGKYYVEFNTHLQKEINELQAQGMDKEEAEKQAPLMLQAQEMLRKWEAGDQEVVDLWKTMNSWVYEGFDVTYKKMGIDFDKIYYESQTYLLGKEIVIKGLNEGFLTQREDGSVWADLRNQGLDEKLLLRADGTSVYMTQDLGTAKQRQEDYHAEKLIYVVGNEQNYHFDVLKRVLIKLGYAWGEKLSHLSYGMVELPEGKMKSREGTVVDADDLMDNMVETARKMSEELGKNNQFESEEEAQNLYQTIAMGALKYFILKVDPSKNMLFNPNESIDFNGNTGPFIQYTHARICSLLRKNTLNIKQAIPNVEVSPKEHKLLVNLLTYPIVVQTASQQLSPALIANYLFEIAKDFNGFYQDTPILKEENENIRLFKIQLSAFTATILKSGLGLLGITAPDKM